MKKQNKTFASRARAIEKKYSRAKFDPVEKAEMEAELEALMNEQEAFREAMGFKEQEQMQQYAEGGYMVGGVDISPWASGAGHEQNVAKIYEQLTGILSGAKDTASMEQIINQYITDVTKGKGSLNGQAKAIIDASSKYQIDPALVIAIMQADSSLATAGKGARTNNPGNYGTMDDGSVTSFETIAQGIEAIPKQLAMYRDGKSSYGTPSAPGEGIWLPPGSTIAQQTPTETIISSLNNPNPVIPAKNISVTPESVDNNQYVVDMKGNRVGINEGERLPELTGRMAGDWDITGKALRAVGQVLPDWAKKGLNAIGSAAGWVDSGFGLLPENDRPLNTGIAPVAGMGRMGNLGKQAIGGRRAAQFGKDARLGQTISRADNAISSRPGRVSSTKVRPQADPNIPVESRLVRPGERLTNIADSKLPVVQQTGVDIIRPPLKGAGSQKALPSGPGVVEGQWRYPPAVRSTVTGKKGPQIINVEGTLEPKTLPMHVGVLPGFPAYNPEWINIPLDKKKADETIVGGRNPLSPLRPGQVPQNPGTPTELPGVDVIGKKEKPWIVTPEYKDVPLNPVEEDNTVYNPEPITQATPPPTWWQKNKQYLPYTIAGATNLAGNLLLANQAKKTARINPALVSAERMNLEPQAEQMRKDASVSKNVNMRNARNLGQGVQGMGIINSGVDRALGDQLTKLYGQQEGFNTEMANRVNLQNQDAVNRANMFNAQMKQQGNQTSLGFLNDAIGTIPGVMKDIRADKADKEMRKIQERYYKSMGRNYMNEGDLWDDTDTGFRYKVRNGKLVRV